jgi:hypothetical protein
MGGSIAKPYQVAIPHVIFSVQEMILANDLEEFAPGRPWRGLERVSISRTSDTTDEPAIERSRRF